MLVVSFFFHVLRFGCLEADWRRDVPVVLFTWNQCDYRFDCVHNHNGAITIFGRQKDV